LDTAFISSYCLHIDSVSKFTLSIIDESLTPYQSGEIRKPCIGSVIWYDSSRVLMKVIEYRKESGKVSKSTYYIKNGRLIKATDCKVLDEKLSNAILDEKTIFISGDCKPFYYNNPALKHNETSTESEKLFAALEVYKFLYNRRP
jgi:hypothetical protein